MLASGGCLAGIGFTMSLFINTLSFTDNNTMLDAGKIGIFMGSIVSGLVGIVMLWVALRRSLHVSRVELKWTLERKKRPTGIHTPKPQGRKAAVLPGKQSRNVMEVFVAIRCQAVESVN